MKRNGTFLEDQNTLQTNHRKDLILSKEKHTWAIHANFSRCRYEVNKKAIFQWKTPKSVHSWSNNFWNPIANVSVKVQYGKLQPKTWNRDENTHSNKRCNFFHQHRGNDRKLYSYSFIYVLTTFEHQVSEISASRKSFFLVFAGQKHTSLLGRATIDRLFNCVR